MIVVKLPYFNFQHYFSAMRQFHTGAATAVEIKLGAPFQSGGMRICYADEDVSVLRSDFSLGNDIFSIQFEAAAAGAPLLHFYGFNKFTITAGNILYQADAKQKSVNAGAVQIASYNTSLAKTLLAYPQFTKSHGIYVQVSERWLAAHCNKLSAASNQLFASPTSSLAFPLAPGSRFLSGHHQFYSFFDKQFSPHSKTAVYKELGNYLNTCFLTVIHGASGPENAAISLKIDQLVVCMLNNLNKPLPSLDETASLSGINRHTIRSYFRKAYGTSFHHYFTQRQMEWARQYILQHNGTIKMLCHQIGYQNPSHFAKTFQKHTGLLPSQLFIKKSAE